MDDFDVFNQTPQVPQTENTNIRDDALFGSEDLSNTTATATPTNNSSVGDDALFGSGDLNNTTITAPPTHTFSHDEQEDPSWVIENDLTDTRTSQSNILSNDNLVSATQATSSDDNLFTTQSNTNESNSYSPIHLPPTPENILYNDKLKQQSEDSPSFDMFSNSLSSTDTNQPGSMGMFLTEDASPLQSFNVRRQEEIAQKDVEENRKIEELRRQAKHDLERWYQDRKTHMEQKRQTIKHEEDVFRTKALEQSDRNSCDWSKVVRFLEFSQGTQLSKGKRDLNRMKTSILQATRDKVKRLSENGI